MECKCCKSIVQNREFYIFLSDYREITRNTTEKTTPFPKNRQYLIAVLWEQCRKNFWCRLELPNLHPIYLRRWYI